MENQPKVNAIYFRYSIVGVETAVIVDFSQIQSRNQGGLQKHQTVRSFFWFIHIELQRNNTGEDNTVSDAKTSIIIRLT